MSSIVHVSRVILACIALLFTSGLLRAQTTVAYFPMGENISGATAGGAADQPGTMTSSVGTIGLASLGSGNTFSSNVATASSTLSIAFNGSNSYTGNQNPLYTYFNFGLEAWVNFSSLATTQWVALTGGGSNSGAGILFNPGTGLGGVISGAGYFSIVPTIQTNTWYHVAIVGQAFDDDGSPASSVSFFVNGTQILGSMNNYYRVSNFSLGGDEGGNARLTGLLDEVRFFTFADGQFATSMLSYNAASAIPEPSTYAALVGAAACLAVAFKRRRALGLAIYRRRRT